MATRPSSVRLEFLLDDEPGPGDSMFAYAAASAMPGIAALADTDVPGSEPRPRAAKRREPPKIETVEACLCAHEVLERFEANRAQWYSPELAPYVDGIDYLLRQETRMSEHMHGLPCTDHQDVWSHEMVSDSVAKDPSVQRLHVWQPPIWWMAPIVRRHDKPLNMRLPLAETAAELVQELSEQVPPAWRNKRVVVQLEVETRLYWGGCAPRGWTPPEPSGETPVDRTPWQPCSYRGDGVGFSEDLLYLKKGEPMWLHDQRSAQAPLVRRTLRPGVGLLVAVPVFTFELQESTVAWIKRQAMRMLRWLGVRKTIADRDPTFVHRLKEDEAYWARAFGQPEPTADQMQLVEKLGARLAPASRPALAHRPEAAVADCHVVLVHGGLSSVRGGFGAWLGVDPSASGPWTKMSLLNEHCAWRFEHDSFLRVARNINQLVDAIDRDVIGDQRTGKLVLLAHSRGGNVARFALQRLRQRWPQWRFYALTAGAPHQGTGVFRRIGRRWSGVAGVVGWFRDIASGVLDKQQMVDLLILERALAYDIPPGFRDVEPAGVARMARGKGMPEGMWVWGSEWGPGDDNPLEERLWRRVIEDWAGFEADGDGIVPKQSALAGLVDALDASPAFHTAYFEHRATVEQIRSRLQSLLESAPGA